MPDVVGWGGDGATEDDDTACLLSNEELRQEQRRVVREQDEGQLRSMISPSYVTFPALEEFLI